MKPKSRAAVPSALKLYEQTSVIITTNLSFSDWAGVFGDAFGPWSSLQLEELAMAILTTDRRITSLRQRMQHDMLMRGLAIGNIYN